MTTNVIVQACRFSDLVLSKTDPEWAFTLRASPTSAGILIELESASGQVGFGYATEGVFAGDTLDNLRTGAKEAAAAIKGADASQVGAVLAELRKIESVGWSHHLLAGFETALVDLTAREVGLPLSSFLGGKKRDRILLSRILPLKAPEVVAQNAKGLVEEGYRVLKIKLDHKSVAIDAARITAVRQAVGDDILLTVDANQSYTVKDAIKLWNRTESSELSLFEQPVPKNDLRGLKIVKDNVGCPVEAHEAASNFPRLQRIVGEGLADCVNLGVGLWGPLGVMQAAKICESGGVKYRLGAHVGPRYFAAAAAHCAASFPELWFACELAEWARLDGDPSEELKIENGELIVPDGPGIGIGLAGTSKRKAK